MTIPPRPALLTVALIATLTAPAATLAEEPVAPDPLLLARHEACSAAAAERGMSVGEAQLCAQNYLLLKLSFLPDMDLAKFGALCPAERWKVQQDGYAAYVAWTQRPAPCCPSQPASIEQGEPQWHM